MERQIEIGDFCASGISKAGEKGLEIAVSRPYFVGLNACRLNESELPTVHTYEVD